MHDSPQVALLIETSRGYGREVSLGIARYARLHGPWSFHVTPGDFEQSMPASDYWKGDGVFARIASESIARQLLQRGLPTIALDLNDEQLDQQNPLSRFTDLRVDSRKAAELAATHLMERGYPFYGFVGSPTKVWSDRRQTAFCKMVRSEGYPVHVYEPRISGRPIRWEGEESRLTKWIASLPKPIGIMACNDEHGMHVLDACRAAGVTVPNDVAVVGVDNDELLCGLSDPPLSSVSLNAEEGGFEAAAWLDNLMRLGKNTSRRIEVGALRVVTRRSTDSVATVDQGVAKALLLIRRTAGRDLTPEMVAQSANLSRRELDSRLRSLIGRSVVDEIKRARLGHATKLLEETDYPIPEVAETAGYSSASYMIQVFRRVLDTTPAKYRVSKRVAGLRKQA